MRLQHAAHYNRYLLSALRLRVLVRLLGAKTVIRVDLSFKHNGFNNTNEHSNALLVVVVFFGANQYAVIDHGSSTITT